MDQHFFKSPFALSGDKNTIPQTIDPSGAVSFDQGWGFDYQRDQATDPLAKPIDRGTMNFLFYTITQALRQYQTASFPEFITAAQNGDTAYPYSKGAVVLFRASPTDPFSAYVSVTEGNTTTPPSTSWQALNYQNASKAEAEAMTSSNRIITPDTLKHGIAAYLQANPVDGLIPGSVFAFAGATVPPGTLLCNGQTVSRTTYSRLFAAIGTVWGAGDGSSTFNVPNFRNGDVPVHQPISLGSISNGAVITHRHNVSGEVTIPAHNHGGAVQERTAGVPAGTINSVSAGTPSGTLSAVSAGTPSGSVAGASAGTPSGSVAGASAGTPSGTLNSTGAHTHAYQMSVSSTQGSGAGARDILDMTTSATTVSAGAHTHTFTGAAMGNHTHTFTGAAMGNHTHTFTGAAMGTHGHVFSGTAMADHSHTFTGTALGNHGHGIASQPAATASFSVVSDNGSGDGASSRNQAAGPYMQYVIAY